MDIASNLFACVTWCPVYLFLYRLNWIWTWIVVPGEFGPYSSCCRSVLGILARLAELMERCYTPNSKHNWVSSFGSVTVSQPCSAEVGYVIYNHIIKCVVWLVLDLTEDFLWWWVYMKSACLVFRVCSVSWVLFPFIANSAEHIKSAVFQVQC